MKANIKRYGYELVVFSEWETKDKIKCRIIGCEELEMVDCQIFKDGEWIDVDLASENWLPIFLRQGR